MPVSSGLDKLLVARDDATALEHQLSGRMRDDPLDNALPQRAGRI
jgi:hypothetical protein